MKLLAFILPLLFVPCLVNDYIEREIFIKAIGWKFQLHGDIEFKDSAFNSNGNLTNTIPNSGPSLRIFLIKNSALCSFGAYVREDTANLTTWEKWHDSDTKLYFEQLQQFPQTKIIETKYYKTTIDTVNFLVQYAKYFSEVKLDTMCVYHYYGRLKNLELDISFEYDQEAVGKEYKYIISTSKFIQ